MYKKFALLSLFLGIALTLSGCAWLSKNEMPPAQPPVSVTPFSPIQPTTSSDTVSPPTSTQGCESDVEDMTFRFHNSAQALQVTSNAPTSCEEFPVLTLRLLNPPVSLGTIEHVSYTGNSAGLFVPFAIAKDNESILLRAHMGGPGAGGSSVDYGYAQVHLKSRMNVTTPITDFPIVATAQAYFYDTFGKIIFIEEGENTPVTPKPGPGNNSVIMFRNLVTGEKRVLLDEKDMSYEIVKLDETNNTIQIKATEYHFSNSCLRESDDALSCALKTTTLRSIELPQK